MLREQPVICLAKEYTELCTISEPAKKAILTNVSILRLMLVKINVINPYLFNTDKNVAC